MSDLVERLRDTYENWGLGSKGPAILKESADRITTLEAELQKAREAALEEAAKVAETGGHYVVENVDHLGRFSMHSGSSARAVWSGLDGPAIATAIRALSQDKGAVDKKDIGER